jgi:hypothetical protein
MSVSIFVVGKNYPDNADRGGIVPQVHLNAGVGRHADEVIEYESATSASLIGRLGSSAFRLSTGAVSALCISRHRERYFDDAVTLDPNKQRGYGNG